MDSLYREIKVSWDSALLGRRKAPQAVKITSPGFFTRYYPHLCDWDWEKYFADRNSLYNRIPQPLHGKLDYKKPWDYMDVYYFRPGMEACVSRKVKRLFESLQIGVSQYRLIPIELDNVQEEFYILFYPFLGLFEDSGVIWSQCLFVDEKNGKEVYFKGKDDYLLYLQSPTSIHIQAKKIVLPASYRSYDIINLRHFSHCFLSNRLAISLSSVMGAEMVMPNWKSFCELVFDD